jgi:hypothetical protein
MERLMTDPQQPDARPDPTRAPPDAARPAADPTAPPTAEPPGPGAAANAQVTPPPPAGPQPDPLAAGPPVWAAQGYPPLYPAYGPSGYGGAPAAPVPPYAAQHPGHGHPYGYHPPSPSGYQPQQRTNALAVASMATSICAIVLAACTNGLAGVAGVVGAVLGHVARRQIAERNEAGNGYAVAGIVVGWLAAAVSLLMIALLVTVIVSLPGPFAGPFTT